MSMTMEAVDRSAHTVNCVLMKICYSAVPKNKYKDASSCVRSGQRHDHTKRDPPPPGAGGSDGRNGDGAVMM